MNRGQYCGAGVTGIGDALGTVWGALLGTNINQVDSSTAVANPYVPPVTSTGIFYGVNQIPFQGLRLITDVNGVDYCAVLTSISGFVPFTAFNTECWAPAGGVYMTGRPAASHKLVFDVPAIYGGPVTPFNVCVDFLSYQ